ncbi:regulatory protein GemA [Ectothiorhodospira mobilis]|uniref:regulatory protein GemA n=1 Tax=Ectothiorhodospira mobilis TaxID=195064 RepID=UPI0019033B92|nr:regulatory protein GemA [Ectothiorhodospira mobilis]MBK1690999.1 hypothetical protein [Ectothiorhodospira mobilis]
MSKRKPDARRRTLLGLAHQAAVQLGWDEEFRRQRQQEVTGHASCRDMTDAQLLGWCWHLKDLGADIGIPGPPRRGGARPSRPTRSQLAALEHFAQRLGWTDGLEDERLRGFVRRTAGVSDVRFLTRGQATQVITGMKRWAYQREGVE